MRYNLILLLFINLFITIASCQGTKKVSDISTASNSIDYQISGKYSRMDVDKLGNIYLVDSKNKIHKYDPNFKLLFSNSYNTLGRISHIDVSNPQKIIVYFSDFQNLLFLDNTLSEIKILNLEPLGYWNIQAVAPSVDNFVWIYDPVNFRLVKINESGKVLLNSNELYSGGITGDDVPVIMARDDRIYLYTESQFMIFNIFGELIKTVDLENEGLQFLQSKVIFKQGKELKVRDLKTEFLVDSDEMIYRIENDVIKFYLDKKNQLFVLDNNGVNVTSLQP